MGIKQLSSIITIAARIVRTSWSAASICNELHAETAQTECSVGSSAGTASGSAGRLCSWSLTLCGLACDPDPVLLAQVDEVKSIMSDNIDKVLARGEKLDTLVDKTDSLMTEVRC